MTTKQSAILALAIITIFGFIITYIFYAPGLSSPDTVAQLNQAINNSYDDWHPPAFAILWRALNKFIPNYEGMFLVSILLYWGGFFLISLSRILDEDYYWLALPFFGFSPQLFNIVGTVWKDILFGAALLFFFGLILLLKQRPKLLLLISMPFLLYISQIKHQGIVIGYFLLSYPVYLNIKNFIKYRWLTLVLSLVFSLVVITLGSVLYKNYLRNSLKVMPKFLWQVSMIYDLTGISIYEEDPAVFPEYIKLNTVFNFESLKSHYNSQTSARLVMYPDSVIVLTESKEELSNLVSSWFHAVSKYPYAYLKHRFFVFSSFFGLDRVNCFVFFPDYRYQGTSFTSDASNSARKLFYNYTVEGYYGDGYLWGNTKFYFRPWIYTFITIIGVLYIYLKKSRGEFDLILSLFGISGLMNTFSYLPITLGCDYRYSWFSIIIGTIFLFYGLIEVLKLKFRKL